MTPTPPVIDIRAQVCWRGADGIVRVNVKPQMTLELEDAQASLEASRQLLAGSRAPVLIDMGSTSGLSRDTRRYYASDAPGRYHYAVALLVDSPLSRAIGNFFVGINRPVIPFRMFKFEHEAVIWLLAQGSP